MGWLGVCDVWLGLDAPLLTKPGCPPQIRAGVCINPVCECVCVRHRATAVCVIHVTWPVCDASGLTEYDTSTHAGP